MNIEDTIQRGTGKREFSSRKGENSQIKGQKAKAKGNPESHTKRSLAHGISVLAR